MKILRRTAKTAGPQMRYFPLYQMFILASLLTLFVVEMTYSCICNSRRSIKQRLERSEQAFLGRVIKKDTILVGMSDYENRSVEVVSYRFDVELWLKGFEGVYQTTIVSGFGGPDCGAVWLEGEEYTVFAWNSSEYSSLDNLAQELKYSNRCLSPDRDFNDGAEDEEFRAEYLENTVRRAFARTAELK